jgi:hypothetical protein
MKSYKFDHLLEPPRLIEQFVAIRKYKRASYLGFYGCVDVYRQICLDLYKDSINRIVGNNDKV